MKIERSQEHEARGGEEIAPRLPSSRINLDLYIYIGLGMDDGCMVYLWYRIVRGRSVS